MITATDTVLKDKIHLIAYGDYEKGFEVLKKVFEQRKKCAQVMLSAQVTEGANEFLELCNQEIKKVFGL